MDQLPCLSLSRSVVYLFEYISDITRKTISLASNIWQCTRRRARPSWQGSSLSASQLVCRGPYLFLSTTKKHDHESRLHLTPRPMSCEAEILYQMQFCGLTPILRVPYRLPETILCKGFARNLANSYFDLLPSCNIHSYRGRSAFTKRVQNAFLGRVDYLYVSFMLDSKQENACNALQITRSFLIVPGMTLCARG
ncbi:hypothetical protein Naga_100251g2 [Nannochloropsis gaditana]|uniref:Uncharacterized protein n=1 Tax=Nannochloropsis gaditana TaxID=72520 RepID=W7THP0_9STRA|nr:hypothetical protein Naga_100251g2 [Nannochloropsis gaditana]